MALKEAVGLKKVKAVRSEGLLMSQLMSADPPADDSRGTLPPEFLSADGKAFKSVATAKERNVFVGWYGDAACTQPMAVADFKAPVRSGRRRRSHPC